MELEPQYEYVVVEVNLDRGMERETSSKELRRPDMIAFRDDRGSTLPEAMIAVLIAMIGCFSLGYVVFLATATNKNQGTETTRAVIYAQDKLEKLLSLGAYGPCGQCQNASGNCLTPPVTCSSATLDTTSIWTADFNNCTQLSTSTHPQDGQTGKPCNTTGVTDTGWTYGLLQGGLSPFAVQGDCPTAKTAGATGYIDFLDRNGQVITGACTTITGTQIAYVREWAITDLTSTTAPILNTGGPATKQISVAVFSLTAVNTAGGKPIVELSSLLENPN